MNPPVLFWQIDLVESRSRNIVGSTPLENRGDVCFDGRVEPVADATAVRSARGCIDPDVRTLLSRRGPQVTQPLVLSMIACLATAFGVAECHADVLRGQPLPFGPRRENLFDGLLAAAILIAFPLNFFWIWESWPWYVAFGCVPVLFIGSRLLVTRTTIARWVKFRPAVAIAASLAASILWVIFPPS